MAHIHISKYWARQNVHHEALASALIARDILHSLDPQMKAEDSEFNENTHGLQDARKYLKGNDEPQGSEGESQQVATSEGKPEATVTEGRPESDAHDETPPAPETDMSATHHRRSHHRIRQDEAQRAHSRDWILQAEAAVDALVAALVKQRVEDVKVTLDKVDEVQAHVQELQTLSPTLSPKSNRGSSSRPQSKQAPQKDDPALRVSVNARPISRGTFGIRSSKGDVVEVL
ncbi:hypothetical protein DFS34DRAFT_615950 [Phlyctochytrium arcticum]|nr:hypothetical protein DFS34DRAFT_615950 [Phlyctochytrium arcticum]